MSPHNHVLCCAAVNKNFPHLWKRRHFFHFGSFWPVDEHCYGFAGGGHGSRRPLSCPRHPCQRGNRHAGAFQAHPAHRHLPASNDVDCSTIQCWLAWDLNGADDSAFHGTHAQVSGLSPVLTPNTCSSIITEDALTASTPVVVVTWGQETLTSLGVQNGPKLIVECDLKKARVEHAAVLAVKCAIGPIQELLLKPSGSLQLPSP